MNANTAPRSETGRIANPKINRLFVDRWSPRAFDASDLPDEDLAAIFEAAGWAPSAYNYQPWKFLYAKRGDANWERFVSLLVPGNQAWVKDASVLVFIISDTMMVLGENIAPSHTHSFDAGAAWAQLALAATDLGYHAHGMIGIDLERTREELGVPERYRIEAAAAIGRRADPERLPEPLRQRETPSTRKPVDEIAIKGNFR